MAPEKLVDSLCKGDLEEDLESFAERLSDKVLNDLDMLIDLFFRNDRLRDDDNKLLLDVCSDERLFVSLMLDDEVDVISEDELADNVR